ncbi:PREDICTED: uncharacterized protein ZK1073.1-like [Priapulus caudatus]|uniref:Uncharacterized protein ZK1073.1-like n=1 Tax=Priapulus caudatus TaxID=37621 RepID=A0ABM1E4F5_PRICU|nr:PREDICTED: uncharacterized protein ZK1073.1-like [Priapulus caudatus]
MSTVPVTKHVVGTETAGNLDVYVYGDLEQIGRKPVIMTVHDMGSNHRSLVQFTQHPSMAEISGRVVYVHVDVPGQGDDEPDLPANYSFPTMHQLGQELVFVLDQLNIKYVVALGEGAGANILARFGVAHPKRCLGVCLIHPTSTVAGIIEFVKDKFMGWKLSAGWNPSAEEYLVYHKFGEQLAKASANSAADREAIIQKDVCVFFRIEGVGDVLLEAPERVAHGFLLFIKGCGMLSSTPLPGQERAGSFSNMRGRTMSMEEADKPRRASSASDAAP